MSLIRRGLALAIFLLPLAGCGMQSIPQSLNQVEATVAEVTNQYKRRADLIPNLVATVKGYAEHESETLEAVISARAKATSMTIDPSNMNAEQIQQFQAAQGGLSQALGRLMVVADTGMVRLTDLGWEHGSVSRQYYSIRDGDPNSAKIDLNWTMRFRRPDADLDVRTETRSGLTSTSTQFHFTAEMDVFEHEEKTYSRTWTKSFDRELN